MISRLHSYAHLNMRAVATDVAWCGLCVCVICVCLIFTTANLTKTDEPIEVPFRLCVGSGGFKDPSARWGFHIDATWRIRFNDPGAAAIRPYVKLHASLVCYYFVAGTGCEVLRWASSSVYTLGGPKNGGHRLMTIIMTNLLSSFFVFSGVLAKRAMCTTQSLSCL